MTDLFEALSNGLEMGLLLAVLASLLWGVASVVLSPCHLTTVPLAIAFLGSNPDRPTPTWQLSGVFALSVLGSLLAIGAVTVALGRIAGDFWGLGPWIAAVLMILAGLALLDVFTLPSGVSLDQNKVPRGLPGAAVVGATLGLTLGPCTFAFMTPVIATALAGTLVVQVATLSAFALGHTLAVALAGMLGLRVGTWLNSGAKATLWFKRIAGGTIIAVGIYLIATIP